MTARCLACGNRTPCACGNRAAWSPLPDTRTSEQWEADERRIERVEVNRMFDALDESPRSRWAK